MKICLTFSNKQQAIPYLNRNSTVFLFIYISYATEIIKNDYNKISLVNTTWQPFCPLTKEKHICQAKLERMRANNTFFQPRTFLVYSQPMSAKVRQNIFDDNMFRSYLILHIRFYFLIGQHCLIQYVVLIENGIQCVYNVFTRLHPPFAEMCELIISQHTQACKSELFTFNNAMCLSINIASIIRTNLLKIMFKPLITLHII